MMLNLKEFLARFEQQKMFGGCVVCGAPTQTQFKNQDGKHEYVHNYHETQYVGCKEVWRYWQDRSSKLDRAEIKRKADAGDECAFDILQLADDEDFLDERDYYTPGNYHEYIQSREWKIKATAIKRAEHYKCERCGYRASPATSHELHTHHLTYVRLFKEQRRDIQILCADCHLKETRRRKANASV